MATPVQVNIIRGIDGNEYSFYCPGHGDWVATTKMEYPYPFRCPKCSTELEPALMPAAEVRKVKSHGSRRRIEPSLFNSVEKGATSDNTESV